MAMSQMKSRVHLSPSDRRVRLRGLWGRIIGFATLVVSAGCARDISGAHSALSTAADTAAVTPEVAKSLTSLGQFVLAGPQQGSIDQLTEDQARTIGQIWVQQFFPWVHTELDRQHGSTINRASLRVCQRIYYADTPYEPVANTSDAGATRRAFGPWWLVPLCVEGHPQALLGIAAYATDIRIESGAIRLPKFSGSEFTWTGIPQSVAEFPVSPEAATSLVAAASGARIAAVPRLLMPDFRNGGPEAARWQLALDTPVPFVTSRNHIALQSNSAFIGPSSPGEFQAALLQPAPTQPDQLELQIIDWGTKGGHQTTVLKRLPGAVVDLEPASVKRQ